MNKNEVRRIVGEALQELSYIDWRVTTVWQKMGHLSPNNSRTNDKRGKTWFIDLTNNEGTFPRIFFFSNEEVEGEEWVKSEIKRQLKDLKEKAQFSYYLNLHINQQVPVIVANKARQETKPPIRGIPKPNPLWPDTHLQEARRPFTTSLSTVSFKTVLRLYDNQPNRTKLWLRCSAIMLVGVLIGGLTFALYKAFDKSSPEVPIQTSSWVANISEKDPGRNTSNNNPQLIIPDWPFHSGTPLLLSDPETEKQGDPVGISGSKKNGIASFNLKGHFSQPSTISSKPSQHLFFISTAPVLTHAEKKQVESTQLNAAIEDWVVAYQNHDLKKQISFYSSTMNKYKTNEPGLMDDMGIKEETSQDHNSQVSLVTSKPVIVSDPSGQTALITISKSITKQNGERTNEVTQEQRWQKTNDGWKIVSERALILAQ